MQRDTDRGTDAAASSDADNDDHSRLNENQDESIHDAALDSRDEGLDETGSLAHGTDHASHLRQVSHSTPSQLGGTPVNLKQRALTNSPALTARRLALLAQFEQDLNAKAQAAGQVPTSGELSLMWKGGMAFTSDDVNDNASLTTETNKSSLQDSLKNSENKHQSDVEDQYYDDQATSGDGMDASCTESAPGDVENVTRPILNGDRDDGTDFSAVSAPGDVENVTRFLLMAPRTSLAIDPFENTPSLILPDFDDEEAGISSVSSLCDRVNGSRRIPSEDQTDPAVASNDETQVREDDENSESAFAVARPVDDETRPSAETIDPVAKPPLFKSLRFYFWLLVCTFVLAAIAAVATVASLKLQAQAPAQNATPSASVEGSDVYSSFVALLGEAAFESADSHARQAAHWMIYDDEMRLTTASENLIQRFLLCLFYLATTQNAPWRSCGRSSEPEMVNCTYLYIVDVEFSLKYGGSRQVGPEAMLFDKIPSNRWLSSTHECLWAGVVCDPNYAIMGLDLGGHGIKATLPSELGLLSTLQGLVFYWNEFFGTLPSELAALSVLTRIEFNSNYFTGTIPQRWSDFAHIQLINIGDNMLSGTWPMGLNNLGSLRGVYVFDNLISGALPTEIALLSNLGKCCPWEWQVFF